MSSSQRVETHVQHDHPTHRRLTDNRRARRLRRHARRRFGRRVFVTFSSVKVHRTGGLDGNESSDDDNETSEPDDGNATSPAGNSTDDGNATEPADNSTSDGPDASNATASEDDGSDGGWFEIMNSTQTVDLKQFQGDASAFLGDAEVQAGKYTQIRIAIDEAYGMKDGARVNFTVPSGTLKIVRPWTVEPGEETILTVDFLLDKSIIAKGNGEYSLKPTMKLLVEHDDEEEDADETGDADDEAEGRRGPPEGKGKP
ncbi:MAG: DUF4382 domain-containing protein [Euryarchaeota archaeon]|nr:DUF4382 domain-containing protein [Euryarchaeota archaeon]